MQMAKKSGIQENLTDTPLPNWGKVLMFECPVCGNDLINEVWLNATAIFHVGGLDPQKGPILRGISADTPVDAFFDGFYCSECNHKLKNADGSNVSCDRELVIYLENQSGNCLKAEGYWGTLLLEGPRQVCEYCPKPCKHNYQSGSDNYQNTIQ